MSSFCHLHVHTQFSLLDGAAGISDLMKKAKNDGMSAVALTDHGNMFGAFKFVSEAEKNGIKPIVGCEFYVVEDRHVKTFGKGKSDKRYHQLLLAKNPEGYKNLSKLCSLGFIEGYYSKYPRIDKELLLKYHKGLIATSCCIGAEIPQSILRDGEEKAEAKLKWWIDLFGEDFYIELQRHNLENIDGTGISQEDINQTLLKWAKKYNLKVIATNDSHYVEEEDWNAHDILLCINTGEKQSTPKGDGKGYRFAFPNSEFYFKTQAQMGQLFKDVPFALENTLEIAEKVEKLKLKRDILLPNYELPTGFVTQDDYLRHLTYLGAQKRYSNFDDSVKERLDLELKVIRDMGFSGYFLIVQDFIGAARDIGVAVGPGRGSAAGSAVAFCTGITNIDPIRYNLLFERFLNPERVSMPDIDVDFDDEGRQKVIDYVVDKYGKNQVAQIITYGTMAAKMSIKDVARVMELPLPEANELAKLVPEKPGTTLDAAFKEVEELDAIRRGKDLKASVLREAHILEGSVRNTGIHAAGVIIAPDDITEYIPVCISKDSDLLVTQFDGKVIEDAGMLKMDFLGLKTLTIIRDAIRLIEKNHQLKIDPDDIPLDDPKTYQLYQKGDTVGTFQFESDGMRKYLKQLKPTNIEDLIAMNALYRPGPMDYIPSYINRKHGIETVEYPHELLRPILEPTFGIMIYQEQIMQAAQFMGGYTLGGADILRRAMGKKKADEMEKQRSIFVKGAKEHHNVPESKAVEVFSTMEKFAAYGFNRSHSAAYSVVAFQTAYLKANYPAEYMAAVLTHNMTNIEKITFFIEECRYMGIEVLGPDINESSSAFDVNKKGQIRFGLGAVKGLGNAVVDQLIHEKSQNGPFVDIYDFMVRAESVNKKALEALVMAGALDTFQEIHRAQYFYVGTNEAISNMEKLLKYASHQRAEKMSSQLSLFEMTEGMDAPRPAMVECQPWTESEKLAKEKEIVGFYISGHPLDQYKVAIKAHKVIPLEKANELKGQEITVAGVISAVNLRTDKGGRTFALFTLEDYNSSANLALFRDDFTKNQHLLSVGNFVLVKGKVEEHFANKGQYEFRPKTLSPLEEVKSSSIKSLKLKIFLDKADASLKSDLNEFVDRFQGNSRFDIEFFDQTSGLSVQTFSMNYKINVHRDSLRFLENLEIPYELVW